MSPQQRFVLAVVLMLAVLVGGNFLFPPAPPPETDSSSAQVDSTEPSPGPATSPAVARPPIRMGVDNAGTGCTVMSTVALSLVARYS